MCYFQLHFTKSFNLHSINHHRYLFTDITVWPAHSTYWNGLFKPESVELQCNRMLYQKTYLFTKVWSWQCNHAAEHCVCYKCFVVHEFVGCKCCDSVQEQTCRQLEVTHCHTVRATVHFQTIASVPVTSFIYQSTSVHAQYYHHLLHEPHTSFAPAEKTTYSHRQNIIATANNMVLRKLDLLTHCSNYYYYSRVP